MFNGSMVFAHSLFIEYKRGSGEPPAFGDFGDILPKESIFRHVSAKILPEYLRNLFIIIMYYVCVLKFSILAISLFEYRY